jgi:hypothetical protein
MARKKIPDDQKRKDLTVSVNIILNNKLEEYLKENSINNKSKYVEKLIKDDLKNRGIEFDEIF